MMYQTQYYVPPVTQMYTPQQTQSEPLQTQAEPQTQPQATFAAPVKEREAPLPELPAVKLSVNPTLAEVPKN